MSRSFVWIQMTTLEEVRLQLRTGVPVENTHEFWSGNMQQLRLFSKQLVGWTDYPALAICWFIAPFHQVGEWKLNERKTLFVDDVEYSIREIKHRSWRAWKQDPTPTVAIAVARVTSATLAIAP